MAEPLTELERAVMGALLAGADPRLAVLRDQLSAATVAVRKFTGVGFFTEFFVPPSAARLTEPINNPIGDLFGELDGVDDVGGFLLWLADGALHTLEGVSYGHTWAETPSFGASTTHMSYEGVWSRFRNVTWSELSGHAVPNKRINLTRRTVSVVTSDRHPRRSCAVRWARCGGGRACSGSMRTGLLRRRPSCIEPNAGTARMDKARTRTSMAIATGGGTAPSTTTPRREQRLSACRTETFATAPSASNGQLRTHQAYPAEHREVD